MGSWLGVIEQLPVRKGKLRKDLRMNHFGGKSVRIVEIWKTRNLEKLNSLARENKNWGLSKWCVNIWQPKQTVYRMPAVSLGQ